MKGLGNFLEHNWFFSLLGTYFVFWWPIACVRSFLNSKIQIDDGRENVLDCFAHGFASLAFFCCAGFFGEIAKPSLSPPRTEMVGPLPAMSYLTTLPSFSIYTKNYALSQKCTTCLPGTREGMRRWRGWYKYDTHFPLFL